MTCRSKTFFPSASSATASGSPAVSGAQCLCFTVHASPHAPGTMLCGRCAGKANGQNLLSHAWRRIFHTAMQQLGSVPCTGVSLACVGIEGRGGALPAAAAGAKECAPQRRRLPLDARQLLQGGDPQRPRHPGLLLWRLSRHLHAAAATAAAAAIASAGAAGSVAPRWRSLSACRACQRCASDTTLQSRHACVCCTLAAARSPRQLAAHCAGRRKPCDTIAAMVDRLTWSLQEFHLA